MSFRDVIWGGAGGSNPIFRDLIWGGARGEWGEGNPIFRDVIWWGGRGAFAPTEFEKELLFCVAHNLFFFIFCPHLESHSGTSLGGRGQRGTILYSETSFGGEVGRHLLHPEFEK